MASSDYLPFSLDSECLISSNNLNKQLKKTLLNKPNKFPSRGLPLIGFQTTAT